MSGLKKPGKRIRERRKRRAVKIAIAGLFALNLALLVVNLCILFSRSAKEDPSHGGEASQGTLSSGEKLSGPSLDPMAYFPGSDRKGMQGGMMHSFSPVLRLPDEMTESECETETETEEGKTAETVETVEETSEEVTEETEPESTAHVLSYEQDPRYSVVLKYAPIGIVTTAEGYLNIRYQPTTSSQEIGKASNGTAFTVLEDLGQWLHISSDGYTGYVAKQYCTLGLEAEIMAMQTAVGEASPKEDAVPVFGTPDASGTPIGVLSKGTSYTYIDMLGDWAILQLPDGQRGFADSALIDLSFSLPKPLFLYSNPEIIQLSQEIIAFAKKYLGGKYVFGGETLGKEVDCSGFVLRVYEHFGIHLPRASVDQSRAGDAVRSIQEAIPGDLLFFHGFINGQWTRGIGHVAIYLGNGMMIHACSETRGIVIDYYNYVENPLAIRRVIE